MDGSDDATYWRERAEQLQHALTSRIAIEQAKGILGERLGLEMDAAFALLRYAARGARMKLQDLAVAVVERDETPEEVVRAVARHSATLARVPREKRVVQTELFFRAVNQEIAALDGATFLCECGVPGCMAKVELTLESMRSLQSTPDTFVVIKGHEIPEVETVVDQADGYLIVRKNALVED
ncbi:MAG: ANTAR domain-containing protein [Gaiellaceae bacterium]